MITIIEKDVILRSKISIDNLITKGKLYRGRVEKRGIYTVLTFKDDVTHISSFPATYFERK